MIKLNIIILLSVFLLSNISGIIASSLVTFEDRLKVIKLLKIYDDDNLDEYMTRNDFARCIVKASSSKDKGLDYVDVVTKNGYMFRSINGDFKGEDFIRYNDVSRACLALLGYTNDDFTGNQVIGRNAKFKELFLDENIDKKVNDYFTKRDVLNAIYNTLRTEEHISSSKESNVVDGSLNDEANESINKKDFLLENNDDEDKNVKSISELIGLNGSDNANSSLKTSSGKINILSNTSNKSFYGKKVFDKLVLKINNELNADAYIEKELIGPYIIKPGMSFTSKFEITDNNVYINGLKAKKEDLEYDIGAYGFALVYYDNTNSVIYAYTYREDIEANVYLRKDYVNEVYYNASDMTKPYKLLIGNNKYYIDNEDMKVMFSPSGKYREGDQVLYIASKYLDKGSYSPVDITYDEINKRYHFFTGKDGREIYYNSGDKRWYYDAFIEDDSEVGYKTVKREYTGSFIVPEYDEEHISGGIIYAMKY